MLYSIAKSFSCFAAVFIANRILFGNHREENTYTAVESILIGGLENSVDITDIDFAAIDQNIDIEIASISFESNMEIGIRRKSQDAGQILDFIRLSGKISDKLSKY